MRFRDAATSLFRPPTELIFYFVFLLILMFFFIRVLFANSYILDIAFLHLYFSLAKLYYCVLRRKPKPS